MKTRERKFWGSFAAAVFLSAVSLQSCKEENVEDKFFSESAVAKDYYFTSVLPVLESKCFSCHTYHNSSVTRYDTYAKGAVAAEEMASRTSSAHAHSQMPPPSAAPLTEEEKQVFQQFFELVKGSGERSIATAGGNSQEFGIFISWTAYKFPDFSSREGVTGTFDKTFITYKKKEAADIYAFLREAEILISTNSTTVGNDPVKSANVREFFFSYFTPVIHGQVTDIDPSTKKAKVKFTMNGISQEVIFEMKEVKEDLVFTGRIQDIGHFNAQAALDALQRVCGVFHQDKVWPDISLKAEIKNFRKFSQFTH
ncbi:hypothetical protein BH24BAC1_BH24BAC1_15250 [soil metagenome]